MPTNKDNKNMNRCKLQYGEGLVIARKTKTTPAYVCNVVNRYNLGKTIYGPKAKKIINLALK